MLAVMQEPTGADSLDNLVSFRDEPSPEPFSAEGHYFDPYSQTERLKKTDLDSISNYALALLRQRREITGAEFDYARSQEMQTAPDTGLPKNANETGRLAIDVGREETIDLKLKLYCATGDSEKSFRFDQAMTEFVNRHLAGKGIRMPEIMGYKKVEVDGREYVCSLKKHIKTHSLADQDLKTHMNDFIMAADAVYDFGKSGIRNLKELRQAGVRVTKRGMEVNAKRYLKHMNVSAPKQETADFIAAYREFSAGLRTEIH